ncbi:uncharacterized protein IL334_000011 [Kwoniella shivajii]|uniref:RRM domain-containing protein n=1 Tax=Kwoniella shivajii TaxID=564305 RepID=A0ABZ1CN42_9TREE|nr:hypothetical protein IL334_000011 [Kwoniella shivajii]
MVSPPSTLPSPTPSSSSHSHYQSMSGIPPTGSHRTPSAASVFSQHPMSPREAKGYNQYYNGVNHIDHSSPNYGDYVQPPIPGQTPYNSNIPAAYLPPLTSSPPPHPPPYVPPPQHAMAPDPIHSIATAGQGMLGIGPVSPTGVMNSSWSNGPAPNGWRGHPGMGGFPSQSQPQLPYGRSSLPNGHSQLPINPHEPFGGVGRSSVSSSSIGGLGARSGSGPGDSRERRRERERRDKDEEADDQDAISTIFVVGFPDDMSEREFQNIFIFANGFEAATLKFPSGTIRREPAAALLDQLTQLAAAQAQAQAAGEPGLDFPFSQPALEEAMASLTMAATASTSASTTPSAPMSLTPSVPSGPMLGNPAMPTRRQTIGFARFKTRADALAAREHLQGRKIDSLTGATLKAEMAKKNLHTKRTTSGEELVGLLLRSGRLANLVGNPGSQVGTGSISHPLPGSQSTTLPSQQLLPSAKEAWDSWPASSPNERERSVTDEGKTMPPQPHPIQTQHLSHSQGFSSTDSPLLSNQQQVFQPSMSSSSANQSSSQSNPSASPSLSVKSPAQRTSDSKALLALAEEADELEGWSVNGAVGIGMMDGYHVNRPTGTGMGQRAPEGLGTQGFPNIGDGFGSRSSAQQDPYGTSPPGGSDMMSENGRGLLSGNNPADQNPPINTLYVGNLPAISPPTHPPNFLEESLRGLFSRSPGFKRMSFRQKINGPMCFVEFEEVIYASQAIKDLYGHNLGGLVKGGIRLSYSKNSLGQRGNAHPSSLNPSMFGGIAHTVALAGMSMTSPTTASAQPIPINNGQGGSLPVSAGANVSYGLQLQQGGPSQGHQSPATASISDSRRDANGPSSQSTSLSPTAQPFNISLPNPASPRSRYFTANPPSKAPSPSDAPSSSFSGSSSAVPIPSANASFQPFSSSNTSSGFSPVSSPNWTPASFSWKSSGAAASSGVGGFGGFDFVGAGTALGSLNGAASAWGAGSGSSGERRE